MLHTCTHTHMHAHTPTHTHTHHTHTTHHTHITHTHTHTPGIPPWKKEFEKATEVTIQQLHGKINLNFNQTVSPHPPHCCRDNSTMTHVYTECVEVDVVFIHPLSLLSLSFSLHFPSPLIAMLSLPFSPPLLLSSSSSSPLPAVCRYV